MHYILFMDIQLVWLEAFTMLVNDILKLNNVINAFSNTLNMLYIILYILYYIYILNYIISFYIILYYITLYYIIYYIICYIDYTFCINLFHQIFINILNSTIISSKIINWKSYTFAFSPVSFILLTEKSFEIFAKHRVYAVISDSFALNL